MSQQQTFSGGNSPTIPDIEFVQGNTGGPVGADPATFTINITGDTVQGVNVNGTALTYTELITISDSTTSQKGVVLLASNAETIAGTDTTKATTPDDIKAKLGVQTLHGLAYGAGTTSALQWLAEASNGQIPIGQTAGIPILANITSLDGSITVTNGPGTIDLSASSFKGTGMTIGATTADIITVPLGVVPGTFQFEARVKAFDSATPSSAGYNLYATFRTDGITAILVGDQPIFNEDPALVSADAYFLASGNNAILQVVGVTALTINWAAETALT